MPLRFDFACGSAQREVIFNKENYYVSQVSFDHIWDGTRSFGLCQLPVHE